MKKLLWLVLGCVGMIGRCAAEEYPTGIGTIQFDWNISRQHIIRQGAVEKSARYRMYEIGNVIYTFNNSGTLSEVAVRYSGKPKDFDKTLLDGILTYYQKREITVGAEFYGKVSRLSGTVRTWLESGGSALIALDTYIVKVDSSEITTFFVRIYNPSCNSKTGILRGFQAI